LVERDEQANVLLEEIAEAEGVSFHKPW
jgi:hypothetical protein